MIFFEISKKIQFFIAIITLIASQVVLADEEGLKASNPAMGSTLSFGSEGMQMDVPEIDPINLHAIASGIGMSQTNPIGQDHFGYVDVSNAQVIMQKDSGLLQFYVQGGYYSTPSLGTNYQRANRQTIDSFGLVPLASLSFIPNKNWIFTAGKLNSFGGYENTFTFQNINIDRGLLWNQTSNVSRGFESQYIDGPLTAAVTLNDGFYSNQLNWIGVNINYQLNEQNSASLSWTGSVKASSINTFITPIVQNNSQISNAIYTYKSDHWLIAPYLQYTNVPENPSIGILNSAQTMGAALLTNYRFPKIANGVFSLPLRLEYIGSSGKGNATSPNLLYGPGSSAWSATITPTFQVGKYFLRGEFSYVKAINISSGQAFGASGNSNNQARVMIETGVLY